MKNENILVGLLVVAIVVAVAGTWMNLESFSKITGAPSGTQGVDPGVQLDPDMVEATPSDVDASNEGADCGIASNQISLPGAETGWCNGGNWSTAMENLTLNVKTNLAKYNVNGTGTNTFTYSNIYLGYPDITTGPEGDGEILTQSWILEVTAAEGSDTEIIARNVSGQAETNLTISQAAGIFWNESQGTSTMTWSLEIYQCTESTC